MDVDNRVAYLTARERDVLALLSEGRSDSGIGSALFVTQKTVEFHTRNIFRKLDLPTDRSVNRRVLAALTFLQATVSPGPRRHETVAAVGPFNEPAG